jgi:transposase
MEAYSPDLRQRVVAAVEADELSRSEIAELFHVSTAWIRRLIQHYWATGSLAPRPRRYGPYPKLEDTRRQQLAALVAQDPDATLAELRDRLGGDVSLPTICRAPAQLGLPRKKSPSAPAKGPAYVHARRAGFPAELQALTPARASGSWTTCRRVAGTPLACWGPSARPAR